MASTGYPQFTETGVLKEYITQQGYRLNLNMLDEDDMQSNPNKAAAPTDTITGELPMAIKVYPQKSAPKATQRISVGFEALLSYGRNMRDQTTIQSWFAVIRILGTSL